MNNSSRFKLQKSAFIPRKRTLLSAVFMFVALCSVILWPLATSAQLNSNSFSPVTWYPSGNATTGSVATGDLNHDGFPDLVVGTQCSQPYSGPTCGHSGIFVHLNNGNGTFHLSSAYETDGDGAGPWVSVTIADMNGDGQRDLVVLNAANTGPNAESVSVMRGNGDGTFQAAASFPITAGALARTLTVADVNGDGKPDVIVSDSLYRAATNDSRGGVNVLINNGYGSLASPVRYDSGGYASALNVITADVNHDGFRDILVSNDCSSLDENQLCTGGATIGVLLGNGNGTFQQAVVYSSGGHPFLGGYWFVPIAAVDLNRDGNTDLLVANLWDGWTPLFPDAATVLIGNGDGSFQQPVHYFDGARIPVSIVAGDVDADGLDDAVVLNNCTFGQSCGGDTGAVSVMLGNGNGTLQAPALYYVWAQQGGLSLLPNTVVLSDVNNDSKLDIVIATWNAIGVLLNQTPTPTPTPTPSDNTPPTLSLPGTISVEATAPAGATVTFSASATDDTDPHPIVTCSPLSSSTFPVGTTSVHCTATDASNNSSSGNFNVTVVDTTPPTLSVPPNIFATATSFLGATLSFTTSETDIVDPHPALNCTPQSGSIFALGTTHVVCTGTDNASNQTQKNFDITVTFAWSGVLQPINADGSSVFKLGSTVSVKFALTGASAAVTNAVARLYYAKISNNVAGTDLEATSTASASSANLFRYDATSGQYIFNWGTKGLTAGTYQLKIDLGDGVGHMVLVSLK